MPGLALDCHCCSMFGDDLTDNYQTQTCPSPPLLGSVEWIEDVTHYLGCHSQPGIRKIHRN